ncbi:hypothetical protein BOO69_06875 [Sulfitobacter alexandrii]|uniref:Uncharacterized protein n=1 Tax=Sulfitobacter alexandrii TaxID=1917485 RepID=A0A1J0WG58_9RHOB|nr:hypothetical protein BOO69_06875 [Sulfitobacter alexandrii]
MFRQAAQCVELLDQLSEAPLTSTELDAGGTMTLWFICGSILLVLAGAAPKTQLDLAATQAFPARRRNAHRALPPSISGA